MFGYITVHKPELKIKDFDTYQSFYCGLCHALKRRRGQLSRMTLTYDMTFLAVLLSALYEPETRMEQKICPLHPLQKHMVAGNECIDYAADMNLLLAFYNLADDWHDDHRLSSGALSASLKRRCRRLEQEYPAKAAAVRSYVRALSECEEKKSADLDLAAGLTGQLLGEIFVMRRDAWEPALRKLGFFLGKFIYLMDAYEDAPKDRQTGSYNPWNLQKEMPTDKQMGDILSMMMTECAISFEILPIIRYTDILRNIIYAGVWQRFDALKAERISGTQTGEKDV